MTDIRRISATYKVVTPLVLGGANHHPEFRLQSFANVVRWWWRFLALGRYQGNEQVAAFWDATLFGWNSAPFGRKRVNFRLTSLSDGWKWTGPDISGSSLRQWTGINYLTAQAFGADSGRKPADVSEFTIEARVLTELDAAPFQRYLGSLKNEGQRRFLNERLDQRAEEYELATTLFVDALALVGLAGGLGARSRRGFGSLAISKLAEVDGEVLIADLPDSLENYRDLLRRRLGACHSFTVAGNVPPYSAFSSESRFEICASSSNPAKLMNEIGWAFQIYRSWGQKKQGAPHSHEHVFFDGFGKKFTLNAGSSKSWYDPAFQDDHNIFYDSGSFPGSHTDNRALFGLPHNYGQTQVGWKQSAQDSQYRRRASPIMFHFHRLRGGETVFLCAVIPANLAPNGAVLGVSRGNRQRSLPDASASWPLVHGFSEFVRTPPPSASAGQGKGVIYSDYKPQNVSISSREGAPE